MACLLFISTCYKKYEVRLFLAFLQHSPMLEPTFYGLLLMYVQELHAWHPLMRESRILLRVS